MHKLHFFRVLKKKIEVVFVLNLFQSMYNMCMYTIKPFKIKLIFAQYGGEGI